MAVAASMLTAAYFMLRDHKDYHDLGPDHFDKLDSEAKAQRLVRKLRELGYEADLRPIAA